MMNYDQYRRLSLERKIPGLRARLAASKAEQAKIEKELDDIRKRLDQIDGGDIKVIQQPNTNDDLSINRPRTTPTL